MLAKRRGLGRGLDALLSVGAPAKTDASSADALRSDALRSDALGAGGELRMLPVEFCERGRYQPRVQFDGPALEALTESIRAQGVIQPIVVRPLVGGSGGSRFEIIAGERRWRAAQGAGLAEIPALVRQVNDETALAVALVENLQREDLNPLEEARALKRLIAEFDMTHQEVATVLGRSRATVSNALRLLELTPEVSAMLEDGRLDMGHARALLTLSVDRQHQVALEIVAKGLTAREAEALARKWAADAAPSTKPGRADDPDVRRLQDNLSQRLGAAVKITHKTSGKGRITVDYSSLEQLEGILDMMHSTPGD
ncbi:MAG: ParB/RepB/Spo0J family partition protein [Gammaproteobacteria bacterium]|nr:ParB/RepB/Spo0J family partition protein [Gammaproteobacteria bacterium]